MKPLAKRKSANQFMPDSNKIKDRKKYFGLLKYDRWRDKPLLCRWMRKIKKQGRNYTHNQIILENGVYITVNSKVKMDLVKNSLLNSQKTHCNTAQYEYGFTRNTKLIIGLTH